MFANRSVRPERTGWRDEWISRRHRLWGFDCPMVDIDFLAVEYNQAIPVAVVEYKHKEAKKVDLSKPNYRAIICLAAAASLPFFIVRYSPKYSTFEVAPGNNQALEWVSDEGIRWREADYVDFLYRLRGQYMPEVIRCKIEAKHE